MMALAMIVGRIVYAGSKLALSNQWKIAEIQNQYSIQKSFLWVIAE